MNTLHKLFYALIIILLLSGCAGAKLNKTLKQGSVLQESFKTQIPFTYANGWIVLEVEIENKTYNFILDTGSSNLLTKELAEKLGLKSIATEKVIDINNTSSDVKYTRVKNIKIGNIDFQETITGIVDLNKITEINCTKIDGFIGSNLMRKAVWDFDFQNQLITITNDEKKLNIPSNSTKSKLFIGTAGIPSIIVKINGKKTLNNTVDLGNSGPNLLRADYFKKQVENKLIKRYVSGKENSFGAFGRSENNTFHDLIIDEMQIGNHTINNVFASTSANYGGNIGLSFLKNYRLILNWKKKKMTMLKISDAGKLTYEAYGYSILFKNKGLFINSIIASSNAAKYLKHNDKILRRNGIDYANISELEYCNFLAKEIKNDTSKTSSITVLREGKELTFKLLKTKLL